MTLFQTEDSLLKRKSDKVQCCDVCAQDIHFRNFVQRLTTNNHLLKTEEKLRCEICKLVINSRPDF